MAFRPEGRVSLQVSQTLLPKSLPDRSLRADFFGLTTQAEPICVRGSHRAVEKCLAAATSEAVFRAGPGQAPSLYLKCIGHIR